MDFKKQIELIESDFMKSRKLLQALGDETRQAIVMALFQADCEGLRVGEIARRTHLSRASVAYHMRVLLEVGIVKLWPEGTMNFYTIHLGDEYNHLIQLIEHISELKRVTDQLSTTDCQNTMNGETMS